MSDILVRVMDGWERDWNGSWVVTRFRYLDGISMEGDTEGRPTHARFGTRSILLKVKFQMATIEQHTDLPIRQETGDCDLS